MSNAHRKAILELFKPGVWLHRRDIGATIRSNYGLTGEQVLKSVCETLVTEKLLSRREEGKKGIYYGLPRPLAAGDSVIECYGRPSQRQGTIEQLIPHPQRPAETCAIVRWQDGTSSLSSPDLLTHLDEITLPTDLLINPGIKQTYNEMRRSHGQACADRYLRTLSLSAWRGMTERTPTVSGEVPAIKSHRSRRKKQASEPAQAPTTYPSCPLSAAPRR